MTATAPVSSKIRTVWALSEGHAGMANQAAGLAEALGADTVVKTVGIRRPWSRVPPRLWPDPIAASLLTGDSLSPPWPDVVISCGKRAAVPALAVKRASGGRTFAVHIQQPPVAAERFDLVVVPRHDRLRGDNVFVSEAAVHHVTPERIAAAVERLGPEYSHVPSPRIAVLVGGNNNRYRLTPSIARRLGSQLAEISRDTGRGLLITPSRRTGAENVAALREGLGDAPAAIWDGGGENPYFAFLGLAEILLVTCDSVSMTSEAASTGKPVYVVDLEGRSGRIGRFHEHLRSLGITRPFEGTLDTWSYRPPNDTARAAAEILRRFAARP